MRLIEVGTKELKKGNREEAKDLFDKAYKLYCLFWGLKLNTVNLGQIKEENFRKEKINCLEGNNGKETQKDNGEKREITVWDKLKTIFEKLINCCKE
ncbi:hypothetical protein J7K03_01420 [bacterium]|nr:hypothetical protein [bacterium]